MVENEPQRLEGHEGTQSFYREPHNRNEHLGTQWLEENYKDTKGTMEHKGI